MTSVLRIYRVVGPVLCLLLAGRPLEAQSYRSVVSPPPPADVSAGNLPSPSKLPPSNPDNWSQFDPWEKSPPGDFANPQPPLSPDCAVPDAGPPPLTCAPGGCCSHCGGLGCPQCGPVWFGGLAGLALARDRSDSLVLTRQAADDESDVLNAQDATTGYSAGVEARIGKFIGPGLAVEGVYLWWDPAFAQEQVNDPTGQLNSIIDCCHLTAGGTRLSDIFTGLSQQRFTRRDSMQGAELNLLPQVLAWPDSPVRFTGILGARWLRFREDTVVGAADAGTVFGQNGGTTSGFFDQGLTNDFYGLQFGARLEWDLADSALEANGLSLFVQPKVGFGAVNVHRESVLKRGDGLVAMQNNVSKTDFGMLSQIDLGANLNLTPSKSIFVAYRLMGVTSQGLFEDNIPMDLDNPHELERIHTNSSLILHGIVAGGQIAF